MPVSFLPAEQERRYGRYAGEPSADHLARHFHLDDADRELAGAKRWDHMRLGFAVQLGTVRFLGAFLDEPAAVPGGVANHLAQQLGIPDADCLTLYATARGRWLHSAEIKERHGYREFTDPLARIRARAARRLWRALARGVTRGQRAQLDALLVAGEGGRPSPLDRLRDGPYLRSGAELSRAVGRLDEVRVLTVGLPTIDHVPPGRVTALARFATVEGASRGANAVGAAHGDAARLQCGRWKRRRRTTCSTCSTSWSAPCSPTRPRSARRPGRLRTLRDLDAAALQLRRAGWVLMDDAVDDGAVRGAAFAIVPRAMLAAALEQIDTIVRPPGDLYFTELRAQTGKLRFLPAMLRSVALGATPAGQPTLDAVRHLQEHGRARPGSIGTARLRAKRLEATGQSRGRRGGHLGLSPLPAGFHADRNSPP